MNEDIEVENEDTELPDQPGGEVVEKTPAVPPKDDDVRTAVRELADIVKQQSTPKTVAKEPSADEINEAWAVFNPEKKDPKFFHKMFRLGDDATPEEVAQAKQVWAMQHEGVMRQSVVATKNFLAQFEKTLEEKYAPLLKHIEEQKVEAIRNSFYGSFPVLKDKKYAKLVSACANELSSKQFDSQESYNKALAEGVETAIKEYIPDFSLGQKTKPAGTPPRLPRTSAGGTGGTGGARAAVDAMSSNDIDTLGGE